MAVSAAVEEIRFMERAIRLAERSCGATRPNPPVGAVAVKDGRVIGEGRHRRCGGDHAEVAALKSALRRGHDASGATVYVTLEPCSRAGRVGACCDALKEAHVAKVVWAVPDPNPRNSGRATGVLRAAGIATECWHRSSDCGKRSCAADAAKLIAPFAKHVSIGLPYVTVKLAMSLDGKICDDWGGARWVSSAKARRETGRLRERVDVIMVGAETVRKDNPSLLSHGKRNDMLYRAIVTRSGRLPCASQVFTDDASGRTIVFRVGGGRSCERRLPGGAKTIRVANLTEAMKRLGDMGFMHVLCEGGLELARSLAKDGLVDEWLAVLAPKVIGHERMDRATVVPCVSVLADF